MRAVRAAVTALLLTVPAIASAQALEAHGSAGPTVTDTGYSLSAGVGFSPTPRLTIIVDVQQIRLATRVQTDLRGTTRTAGGTATLGEASLRVSLFGKERVDPYAIVGIGAGVSKPASIGTFPDRGSIDVHASFVGGGFRAPRPS